MSYSSKRAVSLPIVTKSVKNDEGINFELIDNKLNNYLVLNGLNVDSSESSSWSESESEYSDDEAEDEEHVMGRIERMRSFGSSLLDNDSSSSSSRRSFVSNDARSPLVADDFLHLIPLIDFTQHIEEVVGSPLRTTIFSPTLSASSFDTSSIRDSLFSVTSPTTSIGSSSSPHLPSVTAPLSFVKPVEKVSILSRSRPQSSNSHYFGKSSTAPTPIKKRHSLPNLNRSSSHPTSAEAKEWIEAFHQRDLRAQEWLSTQSVLGPVSSELTTVISTPKKHRSFFARFSRDATLSKLRRVVVVEKKQEVVGISVEVEIALGEDEELEERVMEPNRKGLRRVASVEQVLSSSRPSAVN